MLNNLYSKNEVKNYLKENSIFPNKNRGQNFLCDRNIANNIANIIVNNRSKFGLEIGGGLGSLSEILINIYKEIEDDLLVKMNFNNGDLTYLAKQNVLLLNAYLTVRKGAPLSHKSSLYRKFQKDVFAYLDTLSQPIVFILWGSFAQSFAKYIHNPNRLILKSGHPSPLSANRGLFFNNHHFSKANSYLTSFGLTEIDWCNKKTKL